MAEAGDTDDVRRTWDRVAPAWERYRTRLFDSTRGVSDWLVEALDAQPGQTILELTAGPGETGFLVAERVGPDGRLISTDLAPAMVDAALRGAEARGLGNVECRVADAQRIDLPDGGVDGVLSRFGLMLVPDPVRAFGEIRRVLRPYRRLAYAVWGPIDRNTWIGLMISALVQHGHAPSGDPFGPGGVLSLAEPERNRDLLAGAGFQDVSVTEVAGAMPFADVDDYWMVQTTVAGPIADLVASMSPSEVDAVKATIEPSMDPFRTGDGYALPTLATVARAS
jgi:ubiquinone/menaquinone biosynthesis C-methylase UbiE